MGTLITVKGHPLKIVRTFNLDEEGRKIFDADHESAKFPHKLFIWNPIPREGEHCTTAKLFGFNSLMQKIVDHDLTNKGPFTLDELHNIIYNWSWSKIDFAEVEFHNLEPLSQEELAIQVVF